MKHFSLVFLCLILINIASAQQVILNDSIKQAYEEILSLRLKDAQKILTAEGQKNPENVYVDYLENYSDFIRVFISEDLKIFQQANTHFSERYQRIGSLPDSNPYKDLLLANMNLQWAFARLKFSQFFAAAWELNKAYRLVESNETKFPDFVPNDITLGILHIIIGLVPGQYHWMLKIISMEGSVEQGKSEIYHVLETSLRNPAYAYLKTEALFYLGFVELNLSPDQKDLNRLMGQLATADPDNLLLTYLKVDILMRHGKDDEALKILTHIPNTENYFPFYYLDYLRGECLLKKLDPGAGVYYRIFIKHFKGINYVKDSWRKLAWIALLKGDTLAYHQLMDSVLIMGYQVVGADKEAFREAESHKVPNVGLLRARLLFDGGYYHQSEDILNGMKGVKLSPEGTLERTYRYGRIAEKEQRWHEAKIKYRQTLKAGRYSSRYFAANAALMLGQIYETEDSLTLARKYYKQCLKLNFKEYRNSIRGNAKASLSRIQSK